MSRTIRHDQTTRDALDPPVADELVREDEAAALDEADDDDLSDEVDGAPEEPPAEGEPVVDEAAAEGEYASGPDDALGLYLRQMGAIPLLNREKELSLAQKLEYHRNRF